MKNFYLFGLFLIVLSNFVYAQVSFHYSYIPKKVYQNQIFPITIIQTQSTNSKPSFEFNSWGNNKPLNTTPLNITNGSDSFYTFYFKADEHTRELEIPRIFISQNNKKFMLEPKFIKIIPLKKPKDFCGVIATEFKISNYQISNYDKQNYLVTLSIESLEANLEDMYIKDAIEYGVDKLHKAYPKVTAEFYFIIPNSKKKITFTYYNSIKKEFIPLSFKLKVDNTTVTTQSSLNPKYDSFDLLKKYILMFLVGFFFIMFIAKKDFFYLVFGALALITLLSLYVPHKQICIKAKSKLYILPTHTSRVSAVVIKKYTTQVLSTHGDYIKVEYKNHTIGWIKDEDVCKD